MYVLCRSVLVYVAEAKYTATCATIHMGVGAYWSKIRDEVLRGDGKTSGGKEIIGIVEEIRVTCFFINMYYDVSEILICYLNFGSWNLLGS